MRAEFLGMVGHELRVPLTSIKGSTARRSAPRGWWRRPRPASSSASSMTAPTRIAAERDGVHVAVSVADEGRGIAPERLGQLFRKYTATGDREGGVGGRLAGCVKTPSQRGTDPRNRHSRESGNPGGVEWGNGAWGPLQDPVIPAFAGMTEGAGNDGLAFRAPKLGF